MAHELKIITLLKPDKKRGIPVMKAFDIRASVREWSAEKLDLKDLSDLLWAANGINRPDGRRTASSSMNAQDIDIFVFMEEGIYLYDPQKHVLKPFAPGDHRVLPGLTDAPLTLVLVTDITRFRDGEETERTGWARIDCGIVSQNISLFCAGTGLKTRPRASFPGAEKAREILKLKPTQYILLNHPVGYARQ